MRAPWRSRWNDSGVFGKDAFNSSLYPPKPASPCRVKSGVGNRDSQNKANAEKCPEARPKLWRIVVAPGSPYRHNHRHRDKYGDDKLRSVMALEQRCVFGSVISERCEIEH